MAELSALIPGTPVIDADSLLGFVVRHKPDGQVTVVTDAGHGPTPYLYRPEDLRLAVTRQDIGIAPETMCALTRALANFTILARADTTAR